MTPSPKVTVVRPSAVVPVAYTRSRGPRPARLSTSCHSTPSTRTSRVDAAPDGVSAASQVSGACHRAKLWWARAASPLPIASSRVAPWVARTTLPRTFTVSRR
ncbi:hypothetical protein [Streptomyces sp. SCUT-3]|uniref:hypothetical protein n=1 Tax=Streptomyces sp. SCUT-3 TaxID=2684469 RepID=UPI0021755148|nr:hypothetical protein [Streptomyces sp. SCUT-3]